MTPRICSDRRFQPGVHADRNLSASSRVELPGSLGLCAPGGRLTRVGADGQAQHRHPIAGEPDTLPLVRSSPERHHPSRHRLLVSNLTQADALAINSSDSENPTAHESIGRRNPLYPKFWITNQQTPSPPHTYHTSAPNFVSAYGPWTEWVAIHPGQIPHTRS